MKRDSKYIWPIEPMFKICPHDLWGIRENHYVLFKRRAHSGLDITAYPNTPVKAIYDGVVLLAEFDGTVTEGFDKWNDGYGNKIEILNNDGTRVVYGHLRSYSVKPGDVIKQGDIIGYTGCSGGSRVPHLHLEIRKSNTEETGLDYTYNPLDMLPEIDLSKLTKSFDLEPYSYLWKIMASDSPWDFKESDIPYKDDKNYIK